MDRAEIALAGLLHDIGKFYQRAAGRGRAPGFEGCGPDDYGRNGAHATWSAAFVRDLLPERFVQIASTVLYHHRPADWASKAVAAADRLASGERADQTEEQPHNLLSIFCQLGEDERGRPAPAYLPLIPLELDSQVIFPQTGVDGSQAAYHALWTEFTDAVKSLDTPADTMGFVETLYHLLMRYAWSVPSAYYRSTPDISLFDHSRVTAALAVCLADQDEQTLDNLLGRSATAHSMPVAYLVEGDISGVQRFIYTITSKGAAKGLRGRSLYLQLLTEGIARWILRIMGLPITNLVYVGGGHFYMLIPPSEVDRMGDIQRELDTLMIKHHEGALYVALGAVPLFAIDFQAAEFGAKWSEVGQEVSRAKRRRFVDIPEIFDPRGHGGNEETECQVCHSERLDVTRQNPDEPDEPPVRKCALCNSFEDLGWALGQASYLLLVETEPVADLHPGEWRATLRVLGIEIALLDQQGARVPREPRPSPGRAILLGIHGYPPMEIQHRVRRDVGAPLASGIRFTANVTPRNAAGEVATFEDLQKSSHGLKRLGVLRMDVDDLGYLFGRGFRRPDGEDLSTLARIASLSTMMSIFFEGWVGVLCQAVNDSGDSGQIYSIYSGGDDLFVVGSWDALPGLAYRISSDLKDYAVGNSLVHVSAGITLHGGKYPLYQAAQQADAALDRAKNLEGKDALTFLGQSLGWSDYERAEGLCDRLLTIQQEPRVGRSLFHVLGQLYAEYQATRRHTRSGTVQFVYGPWMWHSTYLLSRLAERAGGSAEKEIHRLREDLLSDIEVIGLAARWAGALSRPSQEVKEAQ